MYFLYLSAYYPLISPGGRFLVMFPYETENDNKRPCARQQALETESANKRDAARRPPPADRRPPTADRRPPPTSEVLRASSYTPRVSMARFAHGLPTPGRAAHGLLRQVVPDSMLQWSWVYEIDERFISEGLNP